MGFQEFSKAIRYFDYDGLWKKLRKVNYKPLIIAVAVAFLLSTVFSIYMTRILVPDTATTATAPAPNDVQGRQDLAQVVGKPTLNKEATDAILKRNIFNSSGELGDGAETDKRARAGDSSQAVKTSLPLKLEGVIFGGTPYNGLAMIEDLDKKKVDSYVVNDTITGSVKLLEVYPDRVIIEHEGAREYIEIEKIQIIRSHRNAKGKAKPSGGSSGEGGFTPIAQGAAPQDYKEEGFERKGNNIVISDSYKRDLLGPKMSKVLQDAKAVPNMVGGELKGFRLERIREDSIYLKAGFENGDVIEEINGVPLKDAAGAIRLLQSLRNEKEIEVRGNRNGQSFTKNIGVQ